MKILVTGVAGAVGSNIAERFADLGHEVIGIDCLTDYYSKRLKKINIEDVLKSGIKVSYADLAIDNIGHLINGVEMVYHFAAQPGISATTSPEEFIKNNIVATSHLLETVQKSLSVRGFVFISTSSVYGDYACSNETAEPKPTSYYGVTKLAAEQIALSYYRSIKLPVTVLRLFSVFGKRERPEKMYHRLIESILDDKEFPLHEGSEKHIRSYTHISDVANACILVLNNMDKCIGEIFNIGNDKTITTGEGMEIVQDLLGKKAKFIMKPPRLGDQLATSANIDKARKILGYNPKTNIREGLASQIEWHKTKLRDSKS